ncbi:unnamed protein product [Bursaphelenchus okinawaensis]|uniref:Uncharacterized protein n=1 Tax=Bursaphelenchus okinawaensis TaxID=465554 RepID=A0A811LBG7_9BILA|nr:unnamed protein product [Bursaphelenchus okinawaensis]CAG9120959.1 unnamed protein product [Bursaphelenchus okinawaensis]
MRRILALRSNIITARIPDQPCYSNVIADQALESHQQSQRSFNQPKPDINLKNKLHIATDLVIQKHPDDGKKVLEQAASEYETSKPQDIMEKFEKVKNRTANKPSKGFFLYEETQVLNSIRKILMQAEGDQVDIASGFAESLVKLKLAKVESVWLKEMVKFELVKNNISSAIEVYTRFSTMTPHKKLFPAPVFIILCHISTELEKTPKRMRKERDELKAQKERILKIIEASGSKLQKICMEACVLLYGGDGLGGLDVLKRNDMELGVDQLNFIVEISRNTHLPQILLPIVDYGSRILPSHTPTKVKFYNAVLAELGKRGDFERMDKIVQRVWEEVPNRELFKYQYIFHRARHFYRCKNLAIPEYLLEMIRRLGDY